MESQGHEASSVTPEVLSRFLEQLLLARATELARSGRLLEAEALLTSGRGPQSPKEMDLLARIAAQGHRYEQAKRLWTAARAGDPENQEYPRGMGALAEERKKQERIQKALLWASMGVIVLLTVLVCVMLWTKPSSGTEKSKPRAVERAK
jgi:hypothetical protein